MNILLLGLSILKEGFQELGHHVSTCTTRFLHSHFVACQSEAVAEKFRHVSCQIRHELGV